MEKILEQYGMTSSKTVDTPIIKGSEIDKTPGSEKYSYKEIIGSLLYLITKT